MKKVLAAVAVAMTLPMTVMAWEPTGDVNVIVAYKAGSGTDTGARLLATEAQKYIPKTIIIQNLPGADGKIGWTKLVQSKPDGQTIFIGHGDAVEDAEYVAKQIKQKFKIKTIILIHIFFIRMYRKYFREKHIMRSQFLNFCDAALYRYR